MVVEDILAEEYLKLTIKEFDNKRLNEKIIKVGTADSVLDIVLANNSQKYYGDAKVIPILDEDKKKELAPTKYARLGGTVIPVKENIEHYFHLMFKNNDGIMKNKLSCFINENFSPLTLESLNYTYTNQNPKTTYKDIYEKIAFNLPQTGSVTREILAHQVQLDLVNFVYQENKSIEIHKTFVRRMKRFLNIESFK